MCGTTNAQMGPISAFSPYGPNLLRGVEEMKRPAFDLGIEILGLLIYTYETKPSRLKITGVFGDLRGKM